MVMEPMTQFRMKDKMILILRRPVDLVQENKPQ